MRNAVRLLIACSICVLPVTSVRAETLTFDEAPFTSLMTNAYQGTTGLMTYSDSFRGFPLAELTLSAGGQTSGGFSSHLYFRSTFDKRPGGVYPYQHIAGNLMQVYGTELRIDFAVPVTAFGFGAALNATASPGAMQVELFSGGRAVGSHLVDLRRSSIGGANSNSEGALYLGGLVLDEVLLTNLGDGFTAAANYNWVLDNLSYEPAPAAVPEPSTILLTLTAGAAFVRRRCRVGEATDSLGGFKRVADLGAFHPGPGAPSRSRE